MPDAPTETSWEYEARMALLKRLNTRTYEKIWRKVYEKLYEQKPRRPQGLDDDHR